MNKIIAFLIIIFTLIACNLKPANKGRSEEPIILTNKDSLELINGSWTYPGDPLATVFNNSRLRGSDEENIEWFDITIKGDSLIIDYGDGIMGRSQIIKLTRDTLIIKGEMGDIEFYVR